MSMLAAFAASAVPASAQPTFKTNVAEIAYSAPSSCPSEQEFDRRLRRRLDAQAGATLPASLSIRIELQAERAVGEITVTKGARSGARRSVTAASCDEAVDALTLVTALLFEPQPARSNARERSGTGRGSARRVATGSTPKGVVGDETRTRASAAQQSPAAAEERTAAPAAERTSDPEGASERGDERASAAAEPTLPDAADPTKSAASATGRERADRGARSSASTGAEAESGDEQRTDRAAGAPSDHGARSADGSLRGALQLELALALLGALGSLPAPRPGLLGRVGLALAIDARWAAALELSGRTLLSQLERSRQGDARFALHTGAAALCMRAESAGVGLMSSLCAVAELGQLSGEGRDTENPQRAEVLWRALGPSARLALPVARPLAIHAGLELLFPLARDRFEIGGSSLFTVPRLTFRMELGLGVHFP